MIERGARCARAPLSDREAEFSANSFVKPKGPAVEFRFQVLCEPRSSGSLQLLGPEKRAITITELLGDFAAHLHHRHLGGVKIGANQTAY